MLVRAYTTNTEHDVRMNHSRVPCIQTFTPSGNIMRSMHLQAGFFGGGKKPENLLETHTDAVKTDNTLHRD